MKKKRVGIPHLNSSPWLNAAETAEYLRLSVGTVRNLTCCNRLPCHKRGRIVRYHKNDLDAWLRGGNQATAANTRRRGEQA